MIYFFIQLLFNPCVAQRNKGKELNRPVVALLIAFPFDRAAAEVVSIICGGSW